MNKEDKNIAWFGFKIFVAVILVIVGLILIFGSWGTVGAGERGVKTRFGKILGVVETGLYFKFPIIDHVTIMDVQIQKEQTDASAASSDLQTVNAKVAVNYSIEPTKIGDLYSRIGTEYKIKIIDPAIQEVVKAVTAKYTAEQLITKRAEVTDLIQNGLSERLSAYDISVSSVSITNFDFSKSFNEAIEAKVTAEQNALASKNLLEQKKYEAEQTVVTARAQAESIKIQAQAITSQGGEDYVKLQALLKWNGQGCTSNCFGSGTQMPVPFFNLNK